MSDTQFGTYVSDQRAGRYSWAYERGRNRKLDKKFILRSFMADSPHHTLFFIGQQPLVGQGILTIEASWSHSVWLLRTSDQTDAETPFPKLLGELILRGGKRWTRLGAYERERRNAYRVLVGKHEERSFLGRSRRRREDNITMCLKQAEW